MSNDTPRIRVGIGGWNFAEWRGGVFYPAGLPAAQELHFASRHLTSIEINATFYATQKPATYARWRDETPDGFQFAIKAHRFATQRKALSDGAESVVHFLESGVAELREKLGPIVWQLPPYRRFDADDVESFFALLPDKLDGLPLRHVVEPRNESFACADYVRLARDYGVATVYTGFARLPENGRRDGPFRLRAADAGRGGRAHRLPARRTGRLGKACPSLVARRIARRFALD